MINEPSIQNEIGIQQIIPFGKAIENYGETKEIIPVGPKYPLFVSKPHLNLDCRLEKAIKKIPEHHPDFKAYKANAYVISELNSSYILQGRECSVYSVQFYFVRNKANPNF